MEKILPVDYQKTQFYHCRAFSTTFSSLQLLPMNSYTCLYIETLRQNTNYLMVAFPVFLFNDFQFRRNITNQTNCLRECQLHVHTCRYQKIIDSIKDVTLSVTIMCFWDLMKSTASLCLRFSKFFPLTSMI